MLIPCFRIDHAVAPPWIPCQLDVEARFIGELRQSRSLEVSQAVVSQVQVLQRWHLQCPVLYGNYGAVLQTEVHKTREAHENVVRK